MKKQKSDVANAETEALALLSVLGVDTLCDLMNSSLFIHIVYLPHNRGQSICAKIREVSFSGGGVTFEFRNELIRFDLGAAPGGQKILNFEEFDNDSLFEIECVEFRNGEWSATFHQIGTGITDALGPECLSVKLVPPPAVH
jgi:hypothetical protein